MTQKVPYQSLNFFNNNSIDTIWIQIGHQFEPQWVFEDFRKIDILTLSKQNPSNGQIFSDLTDDKCLLNSNKCDRHCWPEQKMRGVVAKSQKDRKLKECLLALQMILDKSKWDEYHASFTALQKRFSDFSQRGSVFGFYWDWTMKLNTLRYWNPLSAILEDFLSIRFKPHQVVTGLLAYFF